MSSIRIELNSSSKEVKISPAGTISGFDGRVFVVDENTVAKTKAKGIDIPLNVEHCFTDKGCSAVGWFDVNTLELKEDGVYATLTLNKEGEELVKNKNYRYLSPEFIVGENRHVETIEGVALVNSPNFELEINKKGEKVDEKQIQTLQKEINAKENQIQDLQKQLNAKEEQIKNLIDDLKEFHLNAAIKENKILPAEKESLKAMPLDALTSYLETRKPLGMTKENNFQDGQNQKEDNEAKLLKELGWED